MILIISTLMAAAIFGVDIFMRLSTAERIHAIEDPPSADDYDAALVLGCGVYNNSMPSPLLRERLDAAVKLYEAGAVDRIIMSGDHGQPEYNEVRVMKNYAIDKGIPSEAIFMDHAGFSTYESIYRAEAIFGARRLVIVTQRYHLYRALYIADKFKLEAVGLAADRSRLSGQTARDLREILARNKDFVYCLVKPEPTWLGETISLDDSGDITNDEAMEN